MSKQSASAKPEPKIVGPEIQGTVARACGLAVAGLGLLVLFGWATGVESLKNLLPGLASMKANTAICFVLGGVGLLANRHKWGRLVCGALMGAIALVSLSEDFFGWQAGIDEFLFRDFGDSHALPGRMSPMTGICFAAVSLSLLFHGAWSRAARTMTLALTMFVAAVGFLALIGYAYNIQALYSVRGFSSVALHTAASFLVISLGLLAARRDGPAALMTSPGPGGQFFRRLLPAVILLPPFLGWIKLIGEHAGWYPADFGSSLIVCAYVVIFGFLLWTTGRRLDSLERNRQDAAAALKESETRFLTMVNTMPQLAWIAQPDGHLVWYNQRWYEYTGTTPEQMEGWGWQSVHDPNQLPKILARWKASIATGEPFDMTLPLRGADGIFRLFLTRVIPLKDAANRVVQWFGTNTDVDELKRAEQALRNSEERFRTIFEQAPLGIALIDSKTGRFLQSNPKHSEIVGRSHSELLTLDFMSIIHSDDLQAGIESREKLRSGEARSVRMEKRYLHGNGSIVWVSLTVVAMRSDGEEHACDMTMVEDITERKQAQEALVQAKAAAESANRAKDQFLAVLSHELRTPLMPVLATVTAMEGDEGLPPAVLEEVAVIRRNVEMEARIIDDLLDITRISRGKVELHREMVDAHACLRDTLEICQAEIEAKRLQVSMDLNASLYGVWADPTRLRQVFWNLLSNAVKFTPPQGQIILRTSNRGDRLQIQVADDGIGIDPELLPRIFGAFEQGERGRSRQFGGLGLGLSIVKTIVEMHGGQIAVFSGGVNQGATFTLDLSAIPVSIVPGSEDPEHPPTAAGHTRKILLVDDHADTLRTMAGILKKWGYIVETADCVRTALERVARESFDILVSDIGLPDGSGLQIMREVRERHGIRGCALSGYGMDEDLRESREAGFDAHLVKPVNFQELRSVLHRLTLDAA